MITRTQKAPQNHIEGHGTAGGENNMGGVRPIKEMGQALAQTQSRQEGMLYVLL